MTVSDFDLDAKYRQTEGTILLTGIQALIRLTLDQHRADAARGLRTATFISGYQGSPLGMLDLTIKRMLPLLAEHDIRWQPGINEDLAATAVWGTQQRALGRLARHDGVLGMWYGKGPGVDRCGDVFKHANFMGVTDNGGVLAVGGDDPSAKSSTLPTDSNPTFYDALMPILYPGTIQEVLDLGLHGYALSRYSGCGPGSRSSPTSPTDSPPLTSARTGSSPSIPGCSSTASPGATSSVTACWRRSASSRRRRSSTAGSRRPRHTPPPTASTASAAPPARRGWASRHPGARTTRCCRRCPTSVSRRMTCATTACGSCASA